MAKTYTFKELFLNWQKAKAHSQEVNSRYGDTKVTYWIKEKNLAEKAEQFWLQKMGDYGKGIIIQATGLTNEFKTFSIFLMNANTDEVKEYLMARFPNIQKETIELKEFQTGILNV